MNNPLDSGFYTETDLLGFGFKSVGTNVRVAKNTTIVGPGNISFGSNVRVDAYCTILAAGNGKLDIGSYVHIGGHCHLSAGDGIVMGDFSCFSQGVRVYSRSDDYSGDYMTNSTVPEKFTNCLRGCVTLGRHVVVGSGTVVLPGVTMGDGASVGALSLVKESLPAWGVYCGIPTKRLRDRSRRLLELESKLMKEFPGKSG